MGQRLVISITNQGVEVANAYYHWSGYTDSAILLLSKIVKRYEEMSALDDKKLPFVILESTNAKISTHPDDQRILKDLFKDDLADLDIVVDRSEGIICLDKEQMKEQLSYAEAQASFDISTGIVSICSYYSYDSVKEYNLSYEFTEDDEEYLLASSLKQLDYNLYDMTPENLKHFSTFIIDEQNEIFKDLDGYVVVVM